MLRVGRDPVRRPLRLAQRLLEVPLQPLGLQRPGAHERLEDQNLLDGVRHAVLPQRRAQLAPRAHGRDPLVRQLGQRAEPRADVARPLRVVRLAAEQVAREALRALGVAGVERLDGDPEAARVAADVVEREQPQVAVEGGVLDALGHDRRRRLLEAGDEVVRRRAEPLDQPGLAQRPQVLARGQVADVGPVDGQGGDRRLQSLDLRPLPPQPVEVGRERRRGLLGLRLRRPFAEGPLVASQLRPQRRQRRLARRVDEQRRDVVEELVADRPLDRPVAQVLAGVEDLLDPDVRGAAVAQPLQVPRRDRRARRDGRSAGRRPGPPPPAAAPARASPRTPRGPPAAPRRGGRCRRSAGGDRSPGRGRRTSRAAPDRSRTGWRRPSPCGSGRCRAAARARPNGPRPRARGTPPRRRAPPRSSADRRRRSRAWSPRAPRTTATGRGARPRGRAGTARAPQRRGS